MLRGIGWFRTDVSGLRIGTTCKGQDVREDTMWDRYVVPKRRCETNLLCITSQKMTELIIAFITYIVEVLLYIRQRPGRFQYFRVLLRCVYDFISITNILCMCYVSLKKCLLLVLFEDFGKLLNFTLCEVLLQLA
jgi:hypothetical protein